MKSIAYSIAPLCGSLAVADDQGHWGQQITYEFDQASAGGLSGSIKTNYFNIWNPISASQVVNLDFSKFDLDGVKDKYPQCFPEGWKKEDIQMMWHVHVKWNNQNDSGYITDCSPDNTGGHYDPTFACGPASQYTKDTVCTAREKKYNCNSDSFDTEVISCEMGDLSGKFGFLKPYAYSGWNRVYKVYHDTFAPPSALFNKPMYQLENPGWSMVLHLVCSEAKNPRIVCAKGVQK